MTAILRVCRFFILLVAFWIGYARGEAAGRVELDSLSGPAPRTLIKNAALVITMDPSLGDGPLGLVEHADVLFAGDTLTAVGQGLNAAGAQHVDASGKIVLPGFVDVHNHLWQSVVRGCGSDKDLLGWMEECVFPMRDGVIGERDAYAAVRLSSLDLISTGVTTVLDWSHSFTPAFVAGNLRALRDSGLRFVYAYFLRDQSIAELRRIRHELAQVRPRASLQIASHPSMALLDRLTHATRLARSLGVPLNVHLNENSKQRTEEPFQALAAAGAFGVKLVVNHAIHLTDPEIARLAAHGAAATHNPLSNMRLASGIMRLPDLRKAGIALGLGLDGGTQDTSDMFATMKAAIGLQRVNCQCPDTFPSIAEVLRLATLGGAEALGMANLIGSLSPGKQADVILLDPRDTNFAPRWDWLSQIVLNGQPKNVTHVFVAGRRLKADGTLVGVSPAAAVLAAEEAVERIKRALRKRKAAYLGLKQ